jgi:hypothetical protein
VEGRWQSRDTVGGGRGRVLQIRDFLDEVAVFGCVLSCRAQGNAGLWTQLADGDSARLHL